MDDTGSDQRAFRDPAAELRAQHGPDWRSKLAASTPTRAACRRAGGDAWVRQACTYRAIQDRIPDAPQLAAERYPALEAAEALQEDKSQVGLLKVAVLGGLEPAEIQQRLGIEPAVLAAWEALFFDARGSRPHVGWVHHHIIQPERDAGNGELAARLKFVAAAGPAAARAVLDADLAIPLDAGQQLFDRRLKLDLKFEAALAMPLTTPQQNQAFVQFMLELQLQEKRLELEERRLAFRCQEADRRHELAQQRLALEAQRQQPAAASPLAALRWSSTSTASQGPVAAVEPLLRVGAAEASAFDDPLPTETFLQKPGQAQTGAVPDRTLSAA